MTNREFFNAVTAENATITEEMIEHAKAALAKLDAAAEKRKGVVSKKDLEKRAKNEELARHIATSILGNIPMTASDVAEMLTNETGDEVKVQGASYLCRLAVELGLAAQTEVKIPKRGTCKGYTAVGEDAE